MGWFTPDTSKTKVGQAIAKAEKNSKPKKGTSGYRDPETGKTTVKRGWIFR